MRGTERSLKSLNFAWHVALATADAIVLALFVAPELITSATTTQLGVYRALGAAVLPIVVLLLMNVMSSNFKAMLVYWVPWSEWWMRSVPGRRRTIAASNAAVTSSARMWVAMLQPTTRRLQASVIAAR